MMDQTETITLRNPDDQIRSWINNNKNQWEFYEEVLRRETWGGLGKTKEDVINLVGYFEGRYDMALAVQQFVSEKTVKVTVESDDYIGYCR